MPSAPARRTSATRAGSGSPGSGRAACRLRRTVWRRPGELGDERARPAAIGEDGDPVAAAGDRHVQDAPLLLLVLGEAVGHDAVGDAEHGDAVPLPALDPVHGRQRHAGRVGLPLEHRPQPRLEAAGVGVQVGHAEQAVDVVEVADEPCPPPVRSSRLIAAPRPTSSRTASSTWRVVPAPSCVDDDAQVVDEAQHLGGVLVGDLVGERGELGEAPARPAGEPVREPLRQAPRRPAQDLDDVVGRHRVAGRGDAQVGERGAHAGALEHVGAQHRRHRHAGLVERDVRREQQRVDARAARRSTSARHRPRRATRARSSRARRRRRRGRGRRPAAPSGDGSLAGPGSICLATRRWL